MACAWARNRSLRDAELYLALDAREDRRAGPREAQVRLASTIKLEWLEELFPENVRRERLTRYDESRRRVIGANQLWYHDLLLREDPSAAVDPGEAGLVLAEALWPRAAGLIRAKPQAAHWLARLDFVSQALPELGWTRIQRRDPGGGRRRGLSGKDEPRRSRTGRFRALFAEPARAGTDPRAR